jgi:hypothetical protein
MAELEIGQLIKTIIGVFVIVVVVSGLFLFFKNYVLDFFKNIVPTNSTKLILSLI